MEQSSNSELVNALKMVRDSNAQSGVLVLFGGDSFQLDPTVATYIHSTMTPDNGAQILRRYPTNWGIEILNGEKREQVPLTKEMLDSDQWDFIYLKPVSWEDNYQDMRTLIEVIRKLRAPDGCPWDRAQTHKTLAPYLIEETYEALEEIENNDSKGMQEELGDILLQVVLHSAIAQESAEFDIYDVIDSLIQKLVFRHPHVFGNENAKTSSDVEEKWEAIKSRERQGASIMEGLPKELPALLYAHRIQSRASNVGFDWKTATGVLDKLVEEVEEYKQATSDENKSKEFGDIIFTLVNLGRHLNIDVENSLRSANNRFSERFKLMEGLLERDGLSIHDTDARKLEEYWEMSKDILSKS